MTSENKRPLLILGTSLILGMTCRAAMSQAAAESQAPPEEQLQSIVVTGTLIKQNSDLTSPVPITTVAPESLQSTGVLEITQAFRNLPEFAAGNSTDLNIGGGGLQSLNMRNMGVQRTLVLVNGHRMSGFSDAVGNQGTPVDVGMIPRSLISRVDVERDGAGPTYGSDAVAGVVNFILDDNFKGFEVNGQTGISGQGDGNSNQLSSKLGFGNEHGSVVFGADYLHKAIIYSNERDYMINPVTQLTSSQVVRAGSVVGPGGQILNAKNAILACYPIGGGASVAPNCPLYNANAAGVNVLDTGSTIRDIGVLGHYNITDNITFKGQAFYTDRYNDAPIGGYGLQTNTTFGLYNGGFAIPASSSNNPFGQDVRLKWLTLSAGENSQLTDVSQMWSNFGFAGRLFDHWDWEVMQSNSRTYSDQTYTAYPISSHIRNLFIPALCQADLACAQVGAIGNLDSFFSGGGILTPQQAQYGWFDEAVTTIYSVQQTTATISGKLISLPAGDAQAAVGVEYKRTSGNQSMDPITQTQDSARTVLLPWLGGYSTKEGYAEFQVPLLKDLPFARSLDLNAQVRYTSFDAAETNLDNSTTWKAGLSYAVTDDIRFRATYGTSFRAPTPFDLYRGGGVSQQIATDPCVLTGIRATNPTINANCIAAGSPSGPPLTGTTLLGISGGSPSLQPEKGTSLTIGTVFTPTFFENFSATVDFYRLALTDAIGLTNLTQVLQTCYSDPNFLQRVQDRADLCYGYNARNPDGSIGRINVHSINISSLSTRGIDFGADYRFPHLGPVPGDLALDLTASWLGSFYNSAAAVQVRQERGALEYPPWKGSLAFNYHLDQWAVSWTARFLSGMTDPNVLTGSIPTPNPLGYSGTPLYVTNDLSIHWGGAKGDHGRPDVTLGINNVLDKQPPTVISGRGTSPDLFDTLGRYFYLNLGYRF
jgi:iron complex outermembrane recepter protein